MLGKFLLACALLAGPDADRQSARRLLEQVGATMTGIAWVARYEQTRALADLTAATRLLERALSLTPRGDALRPWLLAYLGFAFWTRHSHTDALDDLDRAITYGRHATAATSADHPARGIVERFHVALGPADRLAA
jgi:tetratricopeptide (TPR) repeat protein